MPTDREYSQFRERFDKLTFKRNTKAEKLVYNITVKCRQEKMERLETALVLIEQLQTTLDEVTSSNDK